MSKTKTLRSVRRAARGSPLAFREITITVTGPGSPLWQSAIVHAAILRDRKAVSELSFADAVGIRALQIANTPGSRLAKLGLTR